MLYHRYIVSIGISYNKQIEFESDAQDCPSGTKKHKRFSFHFMLLKITTKIHLSNHAHIKVHAHKKNDKINHRVFLFWFWQIIYVVSYKMKKTEKNAFKFETIETKVDVKLCNVI